MIRVEPRPEPDDFDEQVRQWGLSALAELTGAPPRMAHPGPRRSKIADRVEDLPYDALPPYWRRCLPRLASEYQRLCAYSCHYVHPVTGSGTVDHYVPKSLDPRRAYEWSNYRFTCAHMNARKGTAAEVLDPFEVKDGWFRLELVRFQLCRAPGLPPALADRVQQTIDRLGLNDEHFKQARMEIYRDYREGHIDFAFLERRAPLVARELHRQGHLRSPE